MPVSKIKVNCEIGPWYLWLYDTWSKQPHLIWPALGLQPHLIWPALGLLFMKCLNSILILFSTNYSCQRKDQVHVNRFCGILHSGNLFNFILSLLATHPQLNKGIIVKKTNVASNIYKSLLYHKNQWRDCKYDSDRLNVQSARSRQKQPSRWKPTLWLVSKITSYGCIVV